jgi:fanconi anemia group M protein
MSDDNEVHITVDTKEKGSPIPESLSKQPRVTIEYADLLCGEYVLGQGVGVARKTSNDFIAAIVEKRLFAEAERLKAEYEKPFIIIEGDVYKNRSEIGDVSIDGAITYLTVISGLQVIHTRSAAHTPSMLHRMAVRAQHGVGYDISLRAGKPKDLTPLALFLLEGLPGVGPTGARVLLKHFKTPYAVFTAKPEDFQELKEIGAKAVERIMQVLHLS